MKSPEEIFTDLDSMVGLKKVKDFVRQLYFQSLMERERVEKGIIGSSEPEPLHMIFKGNPGTGISRGR